MATRYILTGGNDLEAAGYGPRLAREVHKTVKRPVTILSCFFATPPGFWDVKAKLWQTWFERSFGDDTVWAYALPERFLEQIKNADVVYLHGGSNDLMSSMLDQYPRLATHCKGKVVVGSSAGANYLAKHYWARRRQRVMRGKGVLPYSVIVHFGSEEKGIPKTDWDSVVRLLADTEATPLKLREGHIEVIAQ